MIDRSHLVAPVHHVNPLDINKLVRCGPIIKHLTLNNEPEQMTMPGRFDAHGKVPRETLAHCIALVKENPQWRLSLQQHKTWGVR